MTFTPARSRIRLPAVGPWPRVYDFFCSHFHRIEANVWKVRFEHGLIQSDTGTALTVDALFTDFAGDVLSYSREVANERVIPFTETILFESETMLVADKPHFLPVAPVGVYLEQTLLRRQQRRLGSTELIPAHRIDQGTAGLVLLIKQRAHRDTYQALFRSHQIEKTYQAIARFNPDLHFPIRRCTHLADADHFMQMREIPGPVNSQTDIDVIERFDDGNALYQLKPKTGKRHQLRAHMCALGIPIQNDPIYPVLKPAQEVLDFSKPLKLLAQQLRFLDPISGTQHVFESRFTLSPSAPLPQLAQRR